MTRNKWNEWEESPEEMMIKWGPMLMEPHAMSDYYIETDEEFSDRYERTYGHEGNCN